MGDPTGGWAEATAKASEAATEVTRAWFKDGLHLEPG